MEYVKKKFVDEENRVISWFSTDDNILCNDGKTLRENLNDIDAQYKEITNQLKLTVSGNTIKLMLGTKELSSITVSGGAV